MTTPDAKTQALADAWNRAGREFFTEYSTRLSKFYGDGDESVDLDMSDPRDQSTGQQVLEAVIGLNAEGRGRQARELFDPAMSPVFDSIKQSKHNLTFVTILGPDELLVRRGQPWESDGVTFHLEGDAATVVPDVQGMCRSRNGQWLVLARDAGLEFRDAGQPLSAAPRASVAWPSFETFTPAGMSDKQQAAWSPVEGWLEVEQLEVSDDGQRLVMSCYRQGILLLARDGNAGKWTLLHPSTDPVFSPHRDEEDPPYVGDMTHVALSRDGQRLAWGNQDSAHYLAEVDGPGAPTLYATVGPISEYPHFACFSDDGRYTALNSCHMYRGATVCFDWHGNRGADLEANEEHPQAPVIDGGLRVYAARWLDRGVHQALAGRDAPDGLFALAGSGVMRLCAPTGELVSVQGFGSSAGSMDYCPVSKRLVVASYSGFIHIYDPFEEELPGRIDGYRPRREVGRWIMWAHLPDGPIRW